MKIILKKFPSTDPLWEKYYGWSPYVYSRNNPVSLLDPSGMADYYDNDGKFLGSDGIDNKDKYITTSDNYNKAKELGKWSDVQGNKVPAKETVEKALTNDRTKFDRNYQETGVVQATDGSSSELVIGPKNKAGESNYIDLIPAANDMLKAGKTPDIFIHTHLESKPGVFDANMSVSKGDKETHSQLKAQLPNLHNSIMINPNNAGWFNFYNGSGVTVIVPTHIILEILKK